MTVPQYGSGKGFIVDLRENSQRHLEESRAERESTLCMGSRLIRAVRGEKREEVNQTKREDQNGQNVGVP